MHGRVAATFLEMRVLDEALDGVYLLEPTVFDDERGSFYESYNKSTFADLTGFDGEFVQDNHSTSVRGVLRGIHYQLPNPQGKLVRCIEGRVWDVAVDLRRSSRTFKKWWGHELSAENRCQLWIPVGFGHGFVVLSERAQVLYRTTEFWDANADRAIRWNDPELSIDWPTANPILSSKDLEAPLLDDSNVFGWDSVEM